MKKLLNTLYVTIPDAYLRLDGESVVICGEEDVIGRIPLINLQSIVCFSYKGVSPALLGACVERGIEVCFLSNHGRFLARVCGPVHGNVLLREAQMTLSVDDGRSLEAAKTFIEAKIYNCRWVIERTLRDHPQRVDEDALRDAIEQHKKCLEQVPSAVDSGELMGIEGAAAKAYF